MQDQYGSLQTIGYNFRFFFFWISTSISSMISIAASKLKSRSVLANVLLSLQMFVSSWFMVITSLPLSAITQTDLTIFYYVVQKNIKLISSKGQWHKNLLFSFSFQTLLLYYHYLPRCFLPGLKHFCLCYLKALYLWIL